MAQGAIAMMEKSLTEGLLLARAYDKRVGDGAGDQEQEVQSELEFYGDLLSNGEF